MPEVAEAPPATEAPALPNPVLPEGVEFSKQTFNEAMEAEKTKVPSQSPDAPKTPPPSIPVIPGGEPGPEPPEKVDVPPEEPPMEVGTTDDKKDKKEKSKVPEELITGKKPEPKADDDIANLDALVPPKNAKPEQQASFSKLKAEAKRIIEERTARINELQTKTSESTPRAEIEAASERIKAAETKAREYEQTIERLAFTESPRFKQFTADETATLSSAKAYFEGTEINPEIIEVAARTVGSQRIKVLRDAGADAEMIAAVSPYLAQYDTIQRHKTGALENWKTESIQYNEQIKAQQSAAMEQRKAEEDKVWDSVASKLKGEVSAFQKFEKHDDWNKRGEELMAKWKQVYNGEGVDLGTVAELLGYGVAYEAEHEIRVAITDELNNALKENARLKAAKPGASNGQVSATASNDENLTTEERAKRQFNAEMARVKGV